MTGLIIPKQIIEKMIVHCRSVYPSEACGILAGRDNAVEKAFEMTNTENSPVSYFMDPKEQFHAMKEMRTLGLDMLAIYHSHPHSPAFPSQKDVSLAFYTDSAYVIVSLADQKTPEVKAYAINDGSISELTIEVRDETA